jgi:hypothetical protein
MASGRQRLRAGLQIVLAIAIVGLSYFLYRSITEPYEAIERQQQMTEMTRSRMADIRTGLIRFEQQNDSFPDSLAHLVRYIREDTTFQADSLFTSVTTLDSLLYSPRTGNRFQYTVNDTGRVETYLLQDPDSDDEIGTLQPDPTKTNAASWE